MEGAFLHAAHPEEKAEPRITRMARIKKTTDGRKSAAGFSAALSVLSV
jgi:hypothetical protein